ncbi:hypothetical protein [Streptomyces sp. NPDC058157]|uniref:hypothetical protein n=1 Tax=Streptomyces sp. NPDC058157 TaxID=3346360 RepID=UPI0036E5FAB4
MKPTSKPLAHAAFLLGLALAFAVSSSVFNTTHRHQAEVDARLTNGADVTVTPPPGTSTVPGAASALHVAGVRHVEPLVHRFAYVGADLQYLYGVRPATITSATSHVLAARWRASSMPGLRRAARSSCPPFQDWQVRTGSDP